jgi:hypothetical protein
MSLSGYAATVVDSSQYQAISILGRALPPHLLEQNQSSLCMDNHMRVRQRVTDAVTHRNKLNLINIAIGDAAQWSECSTERPLARKTS